MILYRLRARLAALRSSTAEAARLRAELADANDRIARYCQTPTGRALHLADQAAAALADCEEALRRGSPSSRREAAVLAGRVRAEIVRPWPPGRPGGDVVDRAKGEQA